MNRTRERMRDPLQEARLFKVRAVVAGILVLFALVFLAGRLVFLQWVEYDSFATASKNNRMRVRASEPTRGMIRDRNGVVLAQNLPAFQLQLIPEEIEDLDETLRRLREILEISERDESRFRKALKRSRRFEPVPIRSNLTELDVARFMVLRHDFPGVDIEATLLRDYPLGAPFGHVIGYVGRINERELGNPENVSYASSSYIGKTGIERHYESMLRGEPGHSRLEVNVAGRAVRTLEEVPPTPGRDLTLTIDYRLQQAAIDAMGDESGSVVAMDPDNGDLLALVSTPVFDPNPFVQGISTKDYRVLSQHPERPMFNRSTQGQYPPGSTVKPHIALMGLQLGVISPTEVRNCPGYYMLPNVDHRYRDWKRWGHGRVNLADAIEQSCDVVFYELANRLGIDRLSSALNAFGFGIKSGVDISGERPGLVPTRQWKRERKGKVWYPGETLIAGIGQGYMMSTPIQLAYGTALIASNGNTPRPHLQRMTFDGVTGEQISYSAKAPAITVQADAGYWRYVRNGMVMVAYARKGTARKVFADSDYRVAAKTGTAQVFSIAQNAVYNAEELERQLRDHALVIAFAPVSHPRIAVAVLVEHGGSGGSTAAPIARKVMDKYLLELFPEYQAAESVSE